MQVQAPTAVAVAEVATVRIETEQKAIVHTESDRALDDALSVLNCSFD